MNKNNIYASRDDNCTGIVLLWTEKPKKSKKGQYHIPYCIEGKCDQADCTPFCPKSLICEMNKKSCEFLLGFIPERNTCYIIDNKGNYKLI